MARRAQTSNSSWWTPERQAYAVNYLKQNANLSDVGARGLVSRWVNVESPGGPGSVNPTSGAEGIGQWLNRKGGYALGDTQAAFDSQLAKAAQELNGSEKAAGDTLRAAATDAQAATGASMFERATGYNPATGKDSFTAQTQAGIPGIASQTPSYARGLFDLPAPTAELNLSPARLNEIAAMPTLYPDAQSAVAGLGQSGGGLPPVPGANNLDPAVASALGFAPTSGGGGTPTQYPAPIPSAAITAAINPNPYTTQAYVPPTPLYSGFTPLPSLKVNNLFPFGPSLGADFNAASESPTSDTGVPDRLTEALGTMTHPNPGTEAASFLGSQGSGQPASPVYSGFTPTAQPSYSGSTQPASPLYSGAPAAGVGPPTSSTNLFSGGDYSGLSANQLPLSNQSPGEAAGFMGQSGYIPPTPPAAPPMQAAQAPGGVMATLGNIVHAVVSSPIGQHIATALQAPGGLTGITGFGGGPLPAGVSNADTFKSFLGGQNWEGPGTGRGASFDPISGGSHYQYFAPSTPGGIGGYVANGQVFTYPTEDTQNFFHTAGN